MAIKNSTYRIFRKLSALALFAGAAACSHSDDPMAPVAGDGVEFRFEIVTGSLVPAVSGGSRAVTMPANTQQGTLAENYLDLENITFLFFDADKRLIAPFHPEVTPVEDSRFVRYEVSAEVADAYFTRPSTPQVTFYIMALANYSAFDPRNFNFTRGMSMEAVFDAAPSFRMPEASPWWYPHIETLDGSSGAWPTAPQHIPMAGVQRFTVDASEFTSSNEKIELTKDINMLRAMAKIEVIDRIEAVGNGVDTTQPPADKRASIEKVELMGCYSRGGILPDMAQWDKRGDIETDYVSVPSVPSSASYKEPYAFNGQNVDNSDAIRYFGEDEAATAAREDGCKVFSVYVPEYKVPTDGAEKAWLQVTVQNLGGSVQVGGASSVLYKLKLTSYGTDGAPAGAEIPLLRNSIYRYEVVSVSTSLINVQWTVCSMTPEVVDIPDFN